MATQVWGAIGNVQAERVAAFTRIAVGTTPILQSRSVTLFGSGDYYSRPDPSGHAWAWSTGGFRRPKLETWLHAAIQGGVAGLVVGDDGCTTLHGDVTGTNPVFVDVSADAVYFSTSMEWLVRTGPPRVPNWNSWAEILAFGAPLSGRTPFEGVFRLKPLEYVSVRGHRISVNQEHWPWLDVALVDDSHLPTGEVLEALATKLSHLSDSSVNVLLSGGRDSRLLAAMLRENVPSALELTAWTTNADTGTRLDEYIAGRVASSLGIKHKVLSPAHDSYINDVLSYVSAVEHLTSFHVWLMPVVEALSGSTGWILDGLGGGLFLGGGFSDPENHVERSPVARRFARLARYLGVADEILIPDVAREIEERARAGFWTVAEPLADHAQGATLTAYLARTLPGISLGPAKLLGGVLPTITPLTSDEVVRLALQVPPSAKRGGAWYAEILRQGAPHVADLRTSAEVSTARHETRRVGTLAAARWYRELLTRGPVCAILSDRLRDADDGEWMAQLNRTRPQHLLRGLAMLTLWLQAYSDKLSPAMTTLFD